MIRKLKPKPYRRTYRCTPPRQNHSWRGGSCRYCGALQRPKLPELPAALSRKAFRAGYKSGLLPDSDVALSSPYGTRKQLHERWVAGWLAGSERYCRDHGL